ncbi:hypothetical protein PENCOP_c001G02734 [Penicillium coprophilum]|uniref:Uncharacterized protein n=1 Tax=Penicillium coprophilum TaxID=36646 RepID=A0A1V6V8K3_9EURO|nr:hypothetical protein PENCOP_c001G02734 [Penicillium coprophilum]
MASTIEQAFNFTVQASGFSSIPLFCLCGSWRWGIAVTAAPVLVTAPGLPGRGFEVGGVAAGIYNH